MKRIIVADKNGTIIATGPHPDDFPIPNGNFGFKPLEGQSVHDVDLPGGIESLKEIMALHTSHSVKVDGKRAYLVERGKSR